MLNLLESVSRSFKATVLNGRYEVLERAFPAQLSAMNANPFSPSAREPYGVTGDEALLDKPSVNTACFPETNRMGQRWVCAVAICLGLSSQVVAEGRPRAGLIASASCTVVRYYVAKYNVAAAEAWARSKGATEPEIEKARHCLKVQTAQQ